MSDFDDPEVVSATLLRNFPHSVGDVSSWQPKRERNDSQCHENDMINLDDLEIENLELLEELLKITSGNKENLSWSG